MMLPNPGMATRLMKDHVDDALRDAERDRLAHEAKGTPETGHPVLADMLAQAHALLLSLRTLSGKHASHEMRGERRLT